jgi:hypothetical protein
MCVPLWNSAIPLNLKIFRFPLDNTSSREQTAATLTWRYRHSAKIGATKLHLPCGEAWHGTANEILRRKTSFDGNPDLRVRGEE